MMKSNDADVFENEELVEQSLEHVRGINKYLRKALKKIESLRNIVEPDQVSNVNNDCVGEATKSSDVVIISSGDDSERDDRIAPVELATSDNLMNGTSKSNPLNDKTRKLACSNTSLNSLNLNSSPVNGINNGINNNSHTKDSSKLNTDNIGTADIQGEPLMKMFKNNEGLNPIEFGKSFQIKMKHQFFRAFIGNLPLSVDFKRIKRWLKSYDIDKCDDIVINKKHNYSTCILSFSEQSQRDHILEKNGELFEGAPLKIGPFVEDNDLSSLTKKKTSVNKSKH